MKACGGLVENEEGGVLAFQSDEIGQLHTLVLTTRECRRTLSHLDVAQSHVFKWLQLVDNLLLSAFAKELDGFRDGHIQHVVDVLAVVFHVEDVALETLPVAGLALQFQVGHELHLHRDHACALAFLASSSVGVEREVLGRESHLLRECLLGKKLADGIVGFHVGGRVRARALSDGVLVYKLHMFHLLPVAFQCDVFTRSVGHFVQMAFQGRVEDTLHQR